MKFNHEFDYYSHIFIVKKFSIVFQYFFEIYLEHTIEQKRQLELETT